MATKAVSDKGTSKEPTSEKQEAGCTPFQVCCMRIQPIVNGSSAPHTSGITLLINVKQAMPTRSRSPSPVPTPPCSAQARCVFTRCCSAMPVETAHLQLAPPVRLGVLVSWCRTRNTNEANIPASSSPTPERRHSAFANACANVQPEICRTPASQAICR